METITATVDWVDDAICQTRIEGHNLPEAAVLELHTWILAVELGCSLEEVAEWGWESEPDGNRYEDGHGWILDWNNYKRM